MPPREEIFRPEGGGGRAIQLPGANAEAFGAGIGRAVERAGNALQEVERDDEWAAKSLQLEEFETELSGKLIDMRASPASEGAGHSDAALKAFDEGRDRLLADVRDRRIRDRLAGSLAQRRTALAAREGAFEVGTRIKVRFDKQGQADDLAAGRLRTEISAASLDALDAAEAAAEQRWRGIGIGGEDAIEAAVRASKAKLQRSAIDGLIDKGEGSAALQMIDKGVFDALSDDERSALRNRADVLIRREASQAAAAQSQQTALLKEQVRAQAAALDVGQGSGDDYRTLASQARSVGMVAEAIKLEADGAAWDAAESFRGAPPALRDAKIAEIQAQPTRTPAEGATLDGLKKQATIVDGMTAIERLTYATGQAVAPIDWSEPASITARSALVASAQETWGGVPEFLLSGEVDELRGIVERGGAAEKAAAARAIVGTGRHAAAILDRVAPGDATFRAAAKLAAYDDGGVRLRGALEGAEALKANRTLLDRPKDAQGKFVGPGFDQVWASLARGPLRGMPPAALEDLRTNTINLYAARAVLGGFTAFRADKVADVLGYGLGGERRGDSVIGGLRLWQGQWVVVPNGMPQAEFENRLGRAGAGDWARAGNGAPLLADGTKAQADDARRMTPVWVGGSRYRLATGPNSFAVTESGDFYTLDIKRLRNW